MLSRIESYSSNFTVAPAMFWGLLLASLAVRLYAVIISPLEPSVDEAQYWLWGQTPQLGYYSKPPLIAWILAEPVLFLIIRILGSFWPYASLRP